jgi:methylase of polypeptide subunit release factors
VGEICVTPATVEGLAETLTLVLLDTGTGGGVVVVSGTEVRGTDVTGTDVTGTGSDVSGMVEFSAGAVLF